MFRPNLIQKNRGGGEWGSLYGLAFIGALVYYWQHANTFWLAVLGIFKALIWPAILVYHCLQFFKL
jgi:hypothetical protein